MPSLHKVNTLFSHPLPLRFILRLLLLVFLLMALGTLGHFWVQGEFQELKDFLDRYTVQWGNGMLLAGSLVYLLLLSLPFVPGAGHACELRSGTRHTSRLVFKQIELFKI